MLWGIKAGSGMARYGDDDREERQIGLPKYVSDLCCWLVFELITFSTAKTVTHFIQIKPKSSKKNEIKWKIELTNRLVYAAQYCWKRSVPPAIFQPGLAASMGSNCGFHWPFDGLLVGDATT